MNSGCDNIKLRRADPIQTLMVTPRTDEDRGYSGNGSEQATPVETRVEDVSQDNDERSGNDSVEASVGSGLAMNAETAPENEEEEEEEQAIGEAPQPMAIGSDIDEEAIVKQHLGARSTLEHDPLSDGVEERKEEDEREREERKKDKTERESIRSGATEQTDKPTSDDGRPSKHKRAVSEADTTANTNADAISDTTSDLADQEGREPESDQRSSKKQRLETEARLSQTRDPSGSPQRGSTDMTGKSKLRDNRNKRGSDLDDDDEKDELKDGSKESRKNNKPKKDRPKEKENTSVRNIAIRALLPAEDAVSVIGRRAHTIKELMRRCGCSLNVSDNYPDADERVLTIRGAPEAVAKAAGLVVRTLNNESYEDPSPPEAKSYRFRLLFPHSIMGLIIGKHGSNFRSLESQSASKLSALEKKLPLSDDRLVTVYGVGDAVHIAVYYLCINYLEKEDMVDQRSRYYDPAEVARRGMRRPEDYRDRDRDRGGDRRGIGRRDDERDRKSRDRERSPERGDRFRDSRDNRDNRDNRDSRTRDRTGRKRDWDRNEDRDRDRWHERDRPGNTGSAPLPPPPPSDEEDNTKAYGNGRRMSSTRSRSQSRSRSRSRSRSPQLSPARPQSRTRSPNGGKASPEPSSSSDTIRETLYISNSRIGSVIGKGGSNVRDVRRKSGANVRVHEFEPGSDDRRVVIEGTPKQCDAAVVLIHKYADR